MFYLDFSAKNRDNSASPEDLRDSTNMQHRYDVVVECGCGVWRIDDSANGIVLATSMDSNEPGGRLLSGLNQFLGAAVVSTEIRTPGLDCILCFNNGLVLSIFAIEVDHLNYALWQKGVRYCVGGRSELTVD
jgi:hypothetical protein